MYLLNGSREYVRPRRSSGGISIQCEDCLHQICNLKLEKSLYKINFFFDTGKWNDNFLFKSKIEQYLTQKTENKIVLNFIFQQPIGSEILAEIFVFDQHIWDSDFRCVENGSVMCFISGNSKIVVGNVNSFHENNCAGNSEVAFRTMENLLKEMDLGFGNIVRQWNYIENILAVDKQRQNYQEFNNVRSVFYEGKYAEGFPAATGIGMNRGGVVIEFIALKSDKSVTYAVENPYQVDAHKYSHNVLVSNSVSGATTPKFARARYIEMDGLKMIFISGTASIQGENTVEVNNPAGQTEVTVKNLKCLYSPEILLSLHSSGLQPVYGHARVYIKNKKDYPVIKKQFRKHFGALPVVYLIADICREDLLVEIEGSVILQ